MQDYTLAWLIIFAMALLGAISFWMLMRRFRRWVFKLPLVLLVVAWFVTPAPVPGYEQTYAPAFVVTIFEAFFQINGQPAQAAALLSVSLLTTLVLGALLGYFLQRYFLARGRESNAVVQDTGAQAPVHTEARAKRRVARDKGRKKGRPAGSEPTV